MSREDQKAASGVTYLQGRDAIMYELGNLKLPLVPMSRLGKMLWWAACRLRVQKWAVRRLPLTQDIRKVSFVIHTQYLTKLEFQKRYQQSEKVVSRG